MPLDYKQAELSAIDSIPSTVTFDDHLKGFFLFFRGDEILLKGDNLNDAKVHAKALVNEIHLGE